MIRGDNIICGTSTTGTGTLTLAATPVPPGGVDFDVFCRATGIGFGNSAVAVVSYTIIEYTDNTYATAKATEKGIGTLTLGGSSGIANATLARSTLQSTATSLNSQPATQNIAPATALNIGTAANTLVFIGASAADVLAWHPYFYNNAGGCFDNTGVGPVEFAANATSGVTGTLATNAFYYTPFTWAVPMQVKKAYVNVKAAYTGGTQNAYIRLYQTTASIGSATPGKLLIDLGVIATVGSSFAATGVVHTAAATNGFFLMPGDYFFCVAVSISGGSGSPTLESRSTSYAGTGRLGTAQCSIGDFRPLPAVQAAGTVSSTPDDPAVTASFSPTNSSIAFTLAPS